MAAFDANDHPVKGNPDYDATSVRRVDSQTIEFRAMIEAALTDFRALEMVLHAKRAEQFLRNGTGGVT